MNNIAGEFHDGRYHGFGLMQIDVGTAKEWVEAEKWKNPKEAIRKGAEILASKRQQILRGVGKTLRITDRKGRKYTYRGAEIKTGPLLLVTVAAYNSGMWSYYHFSKGRNPDQGTTGKNYAADVLSRAHGFALLMRDAAGLHASASLTVDDSADVEPPFGAFPIVPAIALASGPVPAPDGEDTVVADFEFEVADPIA